MKSKNVFKRYENKYIITKKQKEKLLEEISDYIESDQYGKTTIRNVYFDTKTYRLIRRSIEKPNFKEKIRLRAYKKVREEEDVFIELKRKFNKIVYKRRIAISEKEAVAWICMNHKNKQNNQIMKEIQYFLEYYEDLHPMAFISYEREAFCGKEDKNLRITFDENILGRSEDVSLKNDIYGSLVLEEESVVMEIKSTLGMPLWLVNCLSKHHIYKTSFSKYGTYYKKYIMKRGEE